MNLRFININGRVLIFMLALVVLLHCFFMVIYFKNTRLDLLTIQRAAVAQKVENIIQLISATPLRNREHATAVFDDPVLHASISDKPLWKNQFHRHALWSILQILNHNLYSFKVSIEISPTQWLNLNATIYSRIIGKQLILISTELLVLITIVLAIWSTVRYTEPLKQVKTAVEHLSQNLHTKPIDVHGPLAVRKAALAINQMQQRIQQLIHNRTQMLAAISHDLRTPITRLKIRAQFIDNLSLQSHIIHDLDEMEKMISEALSFAREDATREKEVKLDLVSLLRAICDDMYDLGHPVEFHSALHQAAYMGRPIALKRAFTNLINNGIRYGDKVTVRIFTRPKFILIKIEDEGPGIAPADLEKVFQPFYRAEGSRSRDTGGIGLGLAVTNEIIKAHHGDIRLRNRRRGSGLVVLVQLNKTESSYSSNSEGKMSTI